MKKLLLIGLTVLAAGCATLASYERSATGVVEAINRADTRELIELSRTPFLLDGEIILLDRDIETFWTNVIEAGFRVDAREVTASELDEQSFQRFASTMEVDAFFQKYIDTGKGSIVEVQAGDYRILLLMERAGVGDYQVVGFKGPDAI